MQQTLCGHAKSIAGAALVGVGILVFCENLDRAATQLRHLLGTGSGQTLGVLPTVIMAVLRISQAYASGHQRFLQGFIRYMLVSCWPLLLVMVGTVLSRDPCADKRNALQEKD